MRVLVSLVSWNQCRLHLKSTHLKCKAHSWINRRHAFIKQLEYEETDVLRLRRSKVSSDQTLQNHDFVGFLNEARVERNGCPAPYAQTFYDLPDVCCAYHSRSANLCISTCVVRWALTGSRDEAFTTTAVGECRPSYARKNSSFFQSKTIFMQVLCTNALHAHVFTHPYVPRVTLFWKILLTCTLFFHYISRHRKCRHCPSLCLEALFFPFINDLGAQPM